MPAIRISNFEGRIPLISPKLLGDRQAQTAENCLLKRGIIQPMKDIEKDSTVAGLQVVDSNGDDVDDSGNKKVTTTGQCRSIFLNNDDWLRWETEGIDIVNSFIPDSDYRVYYSGDGIPKQTNNTLATSGASYAYGATPYQQGVSQYGVQDPSTRAGSFMSGAASSTGIGLTPKTTTGKGTQKTTSTKLGFEWGL